MFAYLERLAAQGELIYQDDTPVRILSLMDENQESQAQAEAMGLSRARERTGMYTTALVVKVGERTICLYYSGRSHAGENLAALLKKRQDGRDRPLVMSDALSSNEADEANLIRCHCLAHGRRKFSDLEEVFPQECQVVMDALKQVSDYSVLRVRLVLMRLSHLPPMKALHTQEVMNMPLHHCREARACPLASRYVNASSSALVSWRSAVSKPSVNQP